MKPDHHSLRELYEQAATLSLANWNDDDLAIIAFGMIPVERLEEIVNDLIENMAKVAVAEDSNYSHWHLDDMIRQLNGLPTFRTGIEKEVSHALMHNARMVV